MCLIRRCGINAQCFNAVDNIVKFFPCCFLQTGSWRFAVNGIYHYLLRLYLLYYAKPRGDVLVAEIADVATIAVAVHKHCLYYGVAVEFLHCFNERG